MVRPLGNWLEMNTMHRANHHEHENRASEDCLISNQGGARPGSQPQNEEVGLCHIATLYASCTERVKKVVLFPFPLNLRPNLFMKGVQNGYESATR